MPKKRPCISRQTECDGCRRIEEMLIAAEDARKKDHQRLLNQVQEQTESYQQVTSSLIVCLESILQKLEA